MDHLDAAVPKIIWMLWLQGLDNAPLVVKECYKVWVRKNPSWKVIFLDEKSLGQYIDISDITASQSKAGKQAISDVIRLRLLAKYGGVWADSTTYCQVPLDDWLGEHAEGGFFAFGNSTTERVLANWFLMAKPSDYLVSRWEQIATAYLTNNPELKPHSRVTNHLKRWLNKPGTTWLWFSLPMRKWLKVYPYHWPTYLFRELLREDKKCHRLWGKVKFVDSQLSQRLYHAGLRSPITPELTDEINSGETAIYKLMWKKSCQSKHLALSAGERTALDWIAPGVYTETTWEELEGTVLGHLFELGEDAPSATERALRNPSSRARKVGTQASQRFNERRQVTSMGRPLKD